MTAWLDVLPEHLSNVGFQEGPGNRNPWTEEIGIGDVAYCATCATLIPHHHGIDWGPDAQFPHVAIAYSPYVVSWAKKHGFWEDDHASAGKPCTLAPGDIVTYSWGNNGVADHTETVLQVYTDGTFDTVGYNVGTPEGCHAPIRRNRKYLMGRLRMLGNLYQPPAPAPVTPTPAPTPAPAPALEEDLMAIAPSWLPAQSGAFAGRDAFFDVYPHDDVAGKHAFRLVSYNNAPLQPDYDPKAGTRVVAPAGLEAYDEDFYGSWSRVFVGVTSGTVRGLAERPDGRVVVLVEGGATYTVVKR